MADEPEIPESLIAAQRRFDAAHAAVVAASARPGPAYEWPAEAVAELDELRRAEREAALELFRGRAGTPFEAYPQQKRLVEAARQP